MTQLVKLGEKGQVSLPLDIRNKLGLQYDDLLEVSVEDGRIVLERVVPEKGGRVLNPVHTLEDLVGMVTLGGDAVKDSARYDE